MTLLRI